MLPNKGETEMNVVEVRSASKSFATGTKQKTVLNNVSMNIEKGSM